MKNLYFPKVDGMALCLGVKLFFKSSVELEDQKVLVVLSETKADSFAINVADLDGCFTENAESLFFGNCVCSNNFVSSDSDVVLGWINIKKADIIQSCDKNSAEYLYHVNDYGTFKSVNKICDSEKLSYTLPEIKDNELVVNVGSPVYTTLKEIDASYNHRIKLVFKCNKEKALEYFGICGNKCLIPVNVKIQVVDNGLIADSSVIKIDECCYNSIDPESSFFTESDNDDYLIVLTEK